MPIIAVPVGLGVATASVTSPIVFLSVGDSKEDRQKKESMINYINQQHSLGLSPGEVTALVKAPFIGVPISQLKQQSHLATEQMTGASLPGIPTADTTNNQMTEWVAAAVSAYQGQKMNLILKGDNVAKYPVFKNILTAFKKNDQFKFQMVTNPVSVPTGTDLYKENIKGLSAE